MLAVRDIGQCKSACVYDMSCFVAEWDAAEQAGRQCWLLTEFDAEPGEQHYNGMTIFYIQRACFG